MFCEYLLDKICMYHRCLLWKRTVLVEIQQKYPYLLTYVSCTKISEKVKHDTDFFANIGYDDRDNLIEYIADKTYPRGWKEYKANPYQVNFAQSKLQSKVIDSRTLLRSALSYSL